MVRNCQKTHSLWPPSPALLSEGDLSLYQHLALPWLEQPVPLHESPLRVCSTGRGHGGQVPSCLPGSQPWEGLRQATQSHLSTRLFPSRPQSRRQHSIRHSQSLSLFVKSWILKVLKNNRNL